MRTKKIGRREVLGAMGAAAGAALAFGCGGSPTSPGHDILDVDDDRIDELPRARSRPTKPPDPIRRSSISSGATFARARPAPC